MAQDIICADCGATRQRAQYKNTLYCHACRLLRDLQFVGDQRRSCEHCRGTYAPVTRRDASCGACDLGSMYVGDCALCGTSDAALYRPGVAVCVVCVRDPAHRRRVLAALIKGQKARRLANHHVTT